MNNINLGDAIRSYIDDSGLNKNLAAEPTNKTFDPEHKRDVLTEWWIEKAKAETDMVVDKAIEYGATDLYEIGRKILQLQEPSPAARTPTQIILVGIYFYLEGKMARYADAIANDRVVSADTVLDIGVYARMAQRVLEVGAWPGV